MTVLLGAPVATRIITVLQDFLAAELDAIDTAMADSITTPDIVTWHPHEAEVVTAFPSVRIRTGPSVPVPGETFTTAMGNRVDFKHNVTILVDATLDTADDNRLSLERLAMRYAAGIFTILAVKHDGLDTTADPTRWAETTEPNGQIEYGPQAIQENGHRTRSAAIPLIVRRRETG
jgi:hypothetical protein